MPSSSPTKHPILDAAPFNSTDVMDRSVKCVFPSGTDTDVFSAYLDRQCLVLLGHAGAGKTSLFKHFATREQADLHDAANLLDFGVPDDLRGKTVYVDALDEQHTSSPLQTTLAKVVGDLRAKGAGRIRIACRAADWYAGITSPASVERYLDQCQVLALEPLTPPQIVQVLQAAGVEDAADFVREAELRGLHELLGNPQTLLMLQAFVVRGGGWPSGRYALYEGAVAQLLAEHNKQHRQTRRSYSAEQLRNASGGLCALRLLSHIGGFALAPGDHAQFPYYRDIRLDDDDAMLAALGRRVFASTTDNIMDSSHRTVAEFLAASWLAEKIAAGLPLGRVRTLTGVEGLPASSLRGVHAWLTVMLDRRGPDEASDLIDADPSGVLIYADGGVLRPASKRRLLAALAAQAAPSGAEYDSLLSGLNLGRLSDPHMAPIFKDILGPNGDHGYLRIITLDAIRLGAPQPALVDELVPILTAAGDTPWGASLAALLVLPEPPYARLTKVYAQLGVSKRELPLKAALLSGLYNKGLGTREVLSLLEHAQQPGPGIDLSKISYLDIHVGDDDAPALLDGLHEAWSNQPELAQSETAFRVLGMLDASLARVLERAEHCDPANLVNWLRLRHHYSGGGQFAEDAPVVVRALSKRKDLLTALANQSLQLLDNDAAGFVRIMELRDISFGCMTAAFLAERAVALLRNPPAGAAIEPLYDAALRLTSEAGADAAEHQPYLAELALKTPTLSAIQRQHCVAAPPAPLGQPTVTVTQGSSHAALGQHILDNSAEIAAGGQPLALAQVSELYYSPHGSQGLQRLHEALGQEAGDIAASGLVACATRTDILPFQAVLGLAAARRLPESRYAIAAGIELASSPLPSEVLAARLAIASLLSASISGRRKPFATSSGVQSWTSDMCRQNPQLAVTTYERLARSCLASADGPVDGLRLLCANPDLRPYSDSAALQLLRDHPELDEACARILLPFVLTNHSSPENDALLTDMLSRTGAAPAHPAYLMWLAVAMLLAPGRHETALAIATAAAPAALIKALHLVCDMPALRPIGLHLLDMEALAKLVALLVTHAPDTHLQNFMTPTYRLLVMLIDLLESKPEPEAGRLLRQMRENAALASLQKRIERALPKQRTLAVDSHHQRYDWEQILARLNNGPPTSVEDLQALVMDHMEKIRNDIAGSNFNYHKLFWNEDQNGSAIKEKCENSARDVLMGLLAYRLAPHRVDIMSEGSMQNGKRVDIMLTHGELKLVIELKRDSHADLWTAIGNQLDRYTHLPQTSGRGIFGVFWFGHTLPTPPDDLRIALQNSMTSEMAARIKVFVLNVSMPIRPAKTTKKTNAAAKQLTGKKSKVGRKRGTTPS